MLFIKKKKDSEELLPASLPSEAETMTESSVAITVSEEKTENARVKSKDRFSELAEILGEDEDTVKDECYLFGIRKFLSRVGKVIVRYGISEKDFLKLTANAAILNFGEIMLSPAYLSSLKRAVKESGFPKNKIRAVIDFPFGESSFKNKVGAVKECLKTGVKSFAVTMPVLLLEDAKAKDFKKQVKKLGKLAKSVDIAISAQELSEDKIKAAVKAIEKSKVDGIVLVFGDAREWEIKEKIAYIKKNKCSKTIKILGNVETVLGTTELFNLGVDEVLTPYADELGKDLVKSFKIKSVKLR